MTCANGGRRENADGGFTCHCQEPFTGKNCQQVKAHCKDFVTCGHGSCLFKSSYPFYECKCNHPYQLPSCQERVDVCTPNPCQNGGSCSRGLILRRSTFICSCLTGYTGKFCEVEPNDCYEDSGDECLNWNSYFVLQKGGDPFTKYSGFDGLGLHNFCRISDVEMKVVLGGVDLVKDEDYDQTIPVEKAIVHEDYKHTIFAPHNDIALLKLKVTDQSFCTKETPFVKTACLPDQEFQRGESCVVSGWGQIFQLDH